MPMYFQNPKNALRRANEFNVLDKKQAALDVLYEVMKSKRHRQYSNDYHPDIMKLYITLCVDLKKSHIAKEGMYQYKIICQQVNIKALEEAIRFYLTISKERTEAAKSASHKSVLDADDDLDQLNSSEALLMSVVSGEDSQDRSDRHILVPWVKFLWEAHRQSLDLLRNNSSMERLYQEIALSAFKFCSDYNRKTELRKLCDNLRTHLDDAIKYQSQQTAINLNNPETQHMLMETRLELLEHSISMELWQVAFKATEDIHSLMQLANKPQIPKLLAIYYQKLALVFHKSGSPVFHASALQRLFVLSKEMKKNVSNEELQRLASRVILATVSVPLVTRRSEFIQYLDIADSQDEKQRKLANLLSLNSLPTRGSLLHDLERFNVLQHCPKELLELYSLLEKEFDPLRLCVKVANVLNYIREQSNEDNVSYIPNIQSVALNKLIRQLSEAYKTISFDRLMELAPFANRFVLENIIVDSCREGEVPIRLDHRTRSLHFGKELCVSQQPENLRSIDNYNLQPMGSELLRNQLVKTATVLQDAVATVLPNRHRNERALAKEAALRTYIRNMKQEHKEILQRKHLIEKRKEHIETITEQKEKEEQQIADAKAKALAEEEKRRLAKEQEEREKQKIVEERQNLKKQQVQEKLEQLKKTALGKKAFENVKVEELQEMDPDEIMAKQVEQFEREKKELNDRLKAQEKKVDYFERAKRLVEIPKLQVLFADNKQREKLEWEKSEETRIQKVVEEHRMGVKQKERMSRMLEDSRGFIATLTAASSESYEKEVEVFEEKLKAARAERLNKRKEQRKEERKNKWLLEREEERQRRRDEDAKREREELERIKEEELKAMVAQQREEEEMKQRQREDELRRSEEEAARRREESMRPSERDQWRTPVEKVPDTQWRGNVVRSPSRDADYGSRDRDYTPHDRDYPPRERDYPPRDRDNPPREREYTPRDRDYPPRDRDYPPRDRDYPPRERDYPTRDRDYPSRDRDYPPRDRDYPPREREYTPRDRDYPPRERDYPPRDRDYPPRERDYPTRDRDYPTRDRDYPSRDRDYPPREREYAPRERDYPPRDRGYTPRDRDYAPRDTQRNYPRGERDYGEFRREEPPRDGWRRDESGGGGGSWRAEKPTGGTTGGRDEWRRNEYPSSTKEEVSKPKRSDEDEDGWTKVKR